MDMTWMVAEPGLAVEAVDFEEEVALTKNFLLEVTTFYNAYGEECEHEDAVTFVCGREELGWWACPVSDFRFKPH
jgi:hypothetical protein